MGKEVGMGREAREGGLKSVADLKLCQPCTDVYDATYLLAYDWKQSLARLLSGPCITGF